MSLFRIVWAFALLILMLPAGLAGQTDSIPFPGTIKKGGMSVMKDSSSALSEVKKMKSDTASPKEVKPHSPKRAALYSAVLPGLGQAYNKKYWKIPIIAVGAGALVYGYNFNQSRYSLFKEELIKRQQNS
ncbi:MAG: DUF5683 domain-containing protein [Bacteroidia bacterium]